MSGFCGLMSEYKDLSLDRFSEDNLRSTTYWLSHAHSDHMVGLASNSFHERLCSNPKYKLYCTEITKALLSTMSDYSHLDPYVTALPIDQPTVIEMPKSSDDNHLTSVTFTLFPAGHCPGSAMLLIEGEEGAVIYTGDFRLNLGSVQQINHFHDSSGSVKPIKSLYVDTTFFTPKFYNICTREESIDELIDQINMHITKGDNHLVLIRGKAKLGYEHVFAEVYHRLGIKVHVQDRSAALYKHIPSILKTITPGNTPVHSCRKSLDEDDEDEPFLYKCPELGNAGVKLKIITLSTMWFVHNKESAVMKQITEDHVRICYSFHSSYSEVEEMVKYLKPGQVLCNVQPAGVSMLNAQNRLASLLISEPEKTESTPETESWKNIAEVKVWWNGPQNGADGDHHIPSKKVKVELEEGESDSGSGRSTPEMNLFSDSESGDDNSHIQLSDDVGSCDSDDNLNYEKR